MHNIKSIQIFFNPLKKQKKKISNKIKSFEVYLTEKATLEIVLPVQGMLRLAGAPPPPRRRRLRSAWEASSPSPVQVPVSLVGGALPPGEQGAGRAGAGVSSFPLTCWGLRGAVTGRAVVDPRTPFPALLCSAVAAAAAAAGEGVPGLK